MTFRNRPWSCRQCVRRLNLQSSRRLSPLEPRASVDSIPAASSTQRNRIDDDILRRVFDSPPFWREFSQQQRSPAKRAGLVQNEYLVSPDGFREYANATLRKCQELVGKVLGASTVDEYRSMARDLDRLSDLLCRVIDLADFIRMIHHDARVQAAATQAYALMFEYMNVLNTTTGLHEQLGKAAANPEVNSHWSQGEKMVAHILIKDFSNSAIHMPPNERQRFVDLSNDISELGSIFANSAEPAKAQVTVNTSSLRGLDPVVIQQIKKWNLTASVPTTGIIPRLALRTVHDEDTRRKIYLAAKTSSKPQVQRLETLLSMRAELAKLSGYPSYGHMALGDKMAKTPEAVFNFLTALAASNREPVQEELSRLQRMKGPSLLQPWDHDYYVQQRVFEYTRAHKSRALSVIPEFFSLGTVMQGLSRLFDRLYGVRLVPGETESGETWNPDVRRLDVVDESDRRIAVIYCDLFTRPGKNPHPAHFTLRCSREISTMEIAESAALARHPNDGMATAVDRETETLRQLPVIALLCDFADPHEGRMGTRPALLTMFSVRTLFHEMGHAVHSVLGQLPLQSISGTRCATDFAELPSVLMESFATAPDVLGLYARHWQTDEPLSESAMLRMEQDSNAHGSIHGGMDNEAQIVMALVDQAYHSIPSSAASAIDSTKIYHDVSSRYSGLPDPSDPPTSWQGFFGHLYGYGAMYYSYIFDRAIANKIWTDVFKAGKSSVDREAGERYKKEVLRWGGGRNGWDCVAGVLGKDNPSNADGRLAEGGEDAMREVGRWGLGKGELMN